MTGNLILTFNAGSSTVKMGIFKVDSERPRRVGKAMVDLNERPIILKLTSEERSLKLPLGTETGDDITRLLRAIFDQLSSHFDTQSLAAVGHRVVHGGDVFAGPALLDDTSIEKIRDLTNLAPLHQPQALWIIDAARHLWPGLTQTASFDTAFHASISEQVRRFALPRAYNDMGIKRYGFHGLSYRYIAQTLTTEAPDIASGKVVVAHLGSGASLCAIENGASRDTSMGFSTLDGIPMATRTGALDPGVILHLLGPLGKSADEISNILYKQSGLLGMSGISGDTRTLLADESVEAREAIEVFVSRIAGEICRLASTLQGLDAIVFTAGIGEHQPAIRQRIATLLKWLGVELDAEANAKNTLRISAPSSAIQVLVVATDEEQVIAQECAALMA